MATRHQQHVEERQAYMLKQILAFIQEAMYQADPDEIVVMYDGEQKDGDALIEDISDAWGLDPQEEQSV